MNFSKTKNIIFSIAAVILTVAAILIFSGRNEPEAPIQDSQPTEDVKITEESAVPEEEERVYLSLTAPRFPYTLADGGRNHFAAVKKDGTVMYKGDEKCGGQQVTEWEKIASVAAGNWHTVALNESGQVLFAGDNRFGQLDIEARENIAAVACGGFHTVLLDESGKAYAYGRNEHGECDISHWSDLIQIAAGDYHTVGLKSDGTLLYTGKNAAHKEQAESLENIVKISSCGSYILALRADGTATGIGYSDDVAKEIDDWSEVVDIDAGFYVQAGLRKEGNVLTAGAIAPVREQLINSYNSVSIACYGSNVIALTKAGSLFSYSATDDISAWEDIKEFSVSSHILALKEDGTVLAMGSNNYNQCKVSDWENITHVFALPGVSYGIKEDKTVITTSDTDTSAWGEVTDIVGSGKHTVVLKADGTVLAFGENRHGQCNTGEWTDIVKIYAQSLFTVGLKADGTVLITGKPSYKIDGARSWTGVCNLGLDSGIIVGLKNDGTLLYAGEPFESEETAKAVKAFDKLEINLLGYCWLKDGRLHIERLHSNTELDYEAAQGWENIKDFCFTLRGIYALDEEGKIHHTTVSVADGETKEYTNLRVPSAPATLQ